MINKGAIMFYNWKTITLQFTTENIHQPVTNNLRISIANLKQK